MDIKKNDKIINIPKSNNLSISFKEMPEEKIMCEASYSSFDKSLVLHSDKKGWCDAKADYYINRDGSGKELTSWGSKNFPEGTFSEVFEEARTKYLDGGKYTIDENGSLLLLNKITQIIEKLETE